MDNPEYCPPGWTGDRVRDWVTNGTMPIEQRKGLFALLDRLARLAQERDQEAQFHTLWKAKYEDLREGIQACIATCLKDDDRESGEILNDVYGQLKDLARA
jgi:hypothetical protein